MLTQGSTPCRLSWQFVLPVLPLRVCAWSSSSCIEYLMLNTAFIKVKMETLKKLETAILCFVYIGQTVKWRFQSLHIGTVNDNILSWNRHYTYLQCYFTYERNASNSVPICRMLTEFAHCECFGDLICAYYCEWHRIQNKQRERERERERERVRER